MLAMVAHFPRNLGLQVQSQRLGRWQFEAKKKKKLARSYVSNNKKLGMVVHACQPSYTGKRILVQACPQKKNMRP
jgi:hypothetical protein